jgi:D-aspartate ligase
MTQIEATAPVLLLGGDVTTLSLMRSYGRQGIYVSASMDAASCAAASRYCRRSLPIPEGTDSGDYFSELTLSGKYPDLKGSVIISCGDDAVRFVARNHMELSKYYLLEPYRPDLQLDLLNKEKTLQVASQAGLPVPAYRSVVSIEDIQNSVVDLTYPVMLKPRLTYKLYGLAKKKYLLANSESELLEAGEFLLGHGIDFMMCEMIPGPDSQNCSYYTYRTGDGEEYLSLTKRCVRRKPINEGSGTYQLTDKLPDVEELGRKFFDHIHFRGFGSIEFKRDPRNGELKVMECNNRFTAVQEQLVRSCSADVALLTYADITGQQMEPIKTYRPGVAIWSPVSDVSAFREVKSRDKDLSWWDWWRSVDHSEVVFPYFSWRDPAPFLSASRKQLLRLVGRLS